MLRSEVALSFSAAFSVLVARKGANILEIFQTILNGLFYYIKIISSDSLSLYFATCRIKILLM
jgi:predicted amino acid-binding ACT domain protein